MKENTTNSIEKVAIIDKLTNEERFNILVNKCVELVNNDSNIAITIQEKKKKICIRIYTDASHTKFYNMCEIFLKSRYKEIAFFVRSTEYIPNKFKTNEFRFDTNLNFDMKYFFYIKEDDYHSLGQIFTIAHGLARKQEIKKEA